MKNDIRLLYITRKYPPMVGGMESMSAALAKEFTKQVPTTVISWGKSQKYLPYFIFVAFIRSCIIIPTQKITHIHIGDGLLAPLGLLLKYFFSTKASISIAGLDITFTFPGYQLIIPRAVAKLDRIICISNATLAECLKRDIPQEKCVVIPCGIYADDWKKQASREDLTNIITHDVSKKKVIVTVGRLVKRKGVLWFLEQVFPHLQSNVLYLIIGDGPERRNIQEYIAKMRIQKRVFLLGKVSDENLKIIYNTADVFVMPNIIIPGTIEGFGIVAIEASAAGLPVVASNCEGIQDAVIPGKTGVLVDAMDNRTFVETINHLPQFTKEHIRQETKAHYSWNAIGKNYISNFQQL
ncbi:MAG: glycosyltransferase family 4 protein [Patescibacteria group bacterium]